MSASSGANGALDASGGVSAAVYIGGQAHHVVLTPQQAASLTGQQVLGWHQLGHAQAGAPILMQAPLDASAMTLAPTMTLVNPHAMPTNAAPSYDPPSSESAHHGSLAAQIQAQQQVAAATAAGTMLGLKRQLPGADGGLPSPNGGPSGSAATTMTVERVGSSAAQQQSGASQGGGGVTPLASKPAPTAPATGKEAGPAPTGVSSRYHGVTWYKASKRWQARLCTGRRQFHLGYFRTEEEAARAYDRAMIQVQGPKATQLNFPDEAAAVAAGIAAGTGPAVPAALTQATTTSANTATATAAAAPGSADFARGSSVTAALRAGPGSSPALALHASGSFSRRATAQALHAPSANGGTPPGSEPNSADTAAQLTAGVLTAAAVGGGTLSGQRSSSGGAEGSLGGNGAGAGGDSQQQLTPAQHQAMLMAQHQQWQFQYQQQVAAAQARAAAANPAAAAAAARPGRFRLQLQQLQDMPLDEPEPSSTTRMPPPGPAPAGAGGFHDPLGRPLAMQLAAMQSHTFAAGGAQPASRNASAPVLGMALAAQPQPQQPQPHSYAAHHQALHHMVTPRSAGGLVVPADGNGNGHVVQVFGAGAAPPSRQQSTAAVQAAPAPTAPLDTLAAVAAGSYTVAAAAPAVSAGATMMEGVHVVQAAAPAAPAAGGAAPEGGYVQLMGRPAVAGILMADTGEFLPTGTTGALQLYEHEWDGSRLVLRNVLVGLVATPQQQQQQQALQASLPLSEDTHMALAGGGRAAAATSAARMPTPAAMPSSAPDLRGVPPAQALAPAVTGPLVVAAPVSAMDVDQQ